MGLPPALAAEERREEGEEPQAEGRHIARTDKWATTTILPPFFEVDRSGRDHDRSAKRRLVSLPDRWVQTGRVGVARAGRTSQRQSPPGGRRRAAAQSAADLGTPGMGDRLGGESFLEEEVVLTPSRRQLRRREAGWEGSPRRNPAPRNTNRV